MIRIKDSAGNASIKEFPVPGLVTDLLHAGPRLFILATASSVLLWDSELKTVLAELSISGARFGYWSTDGNLLAIIGSHCIYFIYKK